MMTYKKVVLMVLFALLPVISFAQTERWIYRYSLSGGASSCLCYDLAGNLYAGGYTINPGTAYDFSVISLTNSGSERWVYKYPTIARNWDECRSICYGSDGNIYAIGDCTSSDSVLHFTIISLTPEGTERWVYQYSDTSNGRGICYGADGNIYGVGSTNHKILVVSLDTNGNERWRYIYAVPSAEGDPGTSIVCGLDGYIYVTGNSGPEENTDVTVISLTPSGSERWVYLYNGPWNYYDFGSDITYAPDGNLYIFGSTCRLEMPGYVFWKGLVISLNNSGNERWTYINSLDWIWFNRGIYGSDGNLYIAGDFGWDIWYFLVESITNSGNFRWRYINNTWGWANSITYGGDGNIYVAGKTSTHFLPESSYFAVMKFATNGELHWIYRYSPAQPDWFVSANAIVYGLEGNVYAAGATHDIVTGTVFTVISLSPTGIEEKERLKIEGEKLKLMVLPSVVRENAKIQYVIPERQRIRLSMYDILGLKIATIADGIFECGIHCYDFTPSNLRAGIYFLVLANEKETITEKILIVR